MPMVAMLLMRSVAVRLDPHQVVDLLAVGPGLHEARRGEHANAHIGAEPGKPPLGIGLSELRRHLVAGLPPAPEQLGRAQITELPAGDLGDGGPPEDLLDELVPLRGEGVLALSVPASRTDRRSAGGRPRPRASTA